MAEIRYRGITTRGTLTRETLRFDTYDFRLLIADMTNSNPAGLDINDPDVALATDAEHWNHSQLATFPPQNIPDYAGETD